MLRKLLNYRPLITCLALVAAAIVLAAQPQQRGQGTKKLIDNLPSADKRWAIVIGVDEYDDSNINRLTGAVNDAKALAEALKQHAGFKEERVVLLASGEPRERRPARNAILRRLSNLKGALPADALLLVAFAGHGIERGGQSFLLPADAEYSDNPALLEQTSLNVQTLKQFIRETGAKQVFVVLDACRNDPAGGRALNDNRLTEGFSHSFDFNTRNREVEAFVTLYATSVGQRSFEYSEKKQGFFTWALIEGLKGKAANVRGEVTLGGLLAHLESVVPDLVQIELGERQRPFAQVEGYRANELVLAVTGVSPLLELPKPTPTPTPIPTPTPKPTPTPMPVIAYAKVAGPPVRLVSMLFTTAEVDARGKVTKKLGQLVNGFVEELANGVNLELVELPAGTFDMGSPSTEAQRSNDETLRNGVRVNALYMGKYEVTQAQWRAVVGSLPKVSFKGDDLPVEQVSWNDAIEFCRKLSAKTGREYRLPTEAEWEYAVRAGTPTPFAFGPTLSPDIVNYDGNYPYGNAPKGSYRQKTWPVKRDDGVANAWGLFDMHGNVWEWCQDWYGPYDAKQFDNPTGPASGEYRVVRGGSWLDVSRDCRGAFRFLLAPGDRDASYGFRIVLGSKTP